MGPRAHPVRASQWTVSVRSFSVARGAGVHRRRGEPSPAHRGLRVLRPRLAGRGGNGGQWWTFDDTCSIGQKTTWARGRNLLHGTICEMSGDTASGTLMSALDRGLPSPR